MSRPGRWVSRRPNQGVWKVNRISPISIPRQILTYPGGLPASDESHLGYNDGIRNPGLPPTRFRSLRRDMRSRRSAGTGSNERHRN